MDEVKKKILIVDEQPDFREIIGAKLKSVGFTVEVARSSAEAMEKTTSFAPDLILMDIDLSEEATRGPDVALAIHADPKTKNVKIMFLSNMADPWPAMIGDKSGISKELGMEGFLDKGADLDENVSKIKAVFLNPAQKPLEIPKPPEAPQPESHE